MRARLQRIFGDIAQNGRAQSTICWEPGDIGDVRDIVVEEHARLYPLQHFDLHKLLPRDSAIRDVFISSSILVYVFFFHTVTQSFLTESLSPLSARG
mmetsp:Transcript_74661/g.171175  ORF Transcript_74661/g.171175 Transcript_74661/m.171175 type:complete len:97 (+) Transcript_74661:3-293(+)